MAASIKDVAKRAGVSISTVSRVLNGTAKVDAAKEAAVREAVCFYSYEPNLFGRGLVKQRTEMIGVYFQEGLSLDRTYDLELLKGAQEVLAAEGYSAVILTDAGCRKDPAPVFYKYIREKRIDGLLLSGLPDRIRKDPAFSGLMDSGFPVTYIGQSIHTAGMNVYAQFVEYHINMLRVLHDLGHRKILLRYFETHAHYIRQIAEQAASEFPDLTLNPETASGGISPTVLRNEHCVQGFTAVCCPDIRDAERVISACAQMGISVPGDLSVMAVEHRPDEGTNVYPQISAVYVPAREMGRCAGRQLLDALRLGAQAERYREFHADLRLRGSTESKIQLPEDSK